VGKINIGVLREEVRKFPAALSEPVTHLSQFLVFLFLIYKPALSPYFDGGF
jgi:hypothetical protein